jgi:ankyrin repeat protein
MKTQLALFVFLIGAAAFACAQSTTNAPPPVPAAPFPIIPPPLSTNTDLPSSLNFQLPTKPAPPRRLFTSSPYSPLSPGYLTSRHPLPGYPLNHLLVDACDQGNLEWVKTLIGQGAVLDMGVGSFGVTPLMAASKHGDVTRYLISLGAKVDIADTLGNTALLNACFYNQLDAAQALLDAGANPNLPNREGRLPLMDAARNGNDDLVKALLAHHADINGNDAAGSAAWRAAQNDKAGTLTLLIDSGADLSLRPNPVLPTRRFWSLMGCAANDKNLDIIDILLAHGISVNQAGADGTTALMEAARYNQPAALARLLDRGAAVDLQTEKGTTALMEAARFGEQPLVQALLDHHAQLELKDHQGRTALMWAAPRASPENLRLLLDHGADINAADALGDTALTHAGDLGLTDTVQLLKARGARRTDLHIIAKEMPPQPLTPAQRWTLAVSAIYFQVNGRSPNFLGGGESESAAKKALLETWNIQDHFALLKEVDLLYDGTGRTYYVTEGARLAALPDFEFFITRLLLGRRADRLIAIRESYQQWQGRTALAYYLDRAATLINLGFAAHYLDEKEAWSSLQPIARDVQNRFTSWHEMCDNFLDGRQIAEGKADPIFDACGDLLCNARDPNSPWNQIPWNTDLSAP